MAKSKPVVIKASVFLIEGGVDLKLDMSDSSVQRVSNIPFGGMQDFSHDRKKGAIIPCPTAGSKHGDRGFNFQLGKVAFKLYPQAKGHFFGTVREDRSPASSYDEMLEMLEATS